MDFTFLLGQALTNGLIIGLLYLLMAIGFTLVFGVMRVVNFAHGEFYMLGAVLAWAVTSVVPGPPAVGFLAAAIVAPLSDEPTLLAAMGDLVEASIV